MTDRTAPVPALLLALALSACADGSAGPVGGPPPGPPDPPGLGLPEAPVAVSAPLPSGEAHRPGIRGPGVTYVSMLPGTEPLGATAELRSLRRPDVHTVQLVDGGFDPVPVVAAPGETLLVVLTRLDGRRTMSSRPVPASSRPGVVRFSPPSRRTAVPLNSIVQVVFSEPMDSGSVVGALALMTAGAPVPATVTLEGGGLRGVLTPDVSLLGTTTYQVVLDPAATSAAGQAVAVGVSSEFVTADPGVSPPPPDTVGPVVTILSPAPGDTLSADFPVIRVRAQDQVGVQYLYWELVDDSVANAPVGIAGYGISRGALPDAPVLIDLGWSVGPGLHSFRVLAFDTLGHEGRSASLTVFLEPADPTPRLLAQAFHVVAYQTPALPGIWQYSPQLSVADLPRGSGVEIVGLELRMPDGTSWVAASSAARGIKVEPGETVQLFPEIYGDYLLTWFGPDPATSGGALTVARVVYRDPESQRLYEATFQGQVVAGTPPATYTGGSTPWFSGVAIEGGWPMQLQRGGTRR